MSLNTADLVCIDYETVELLPDGATAASPDFWKANFRVLSCAFSWYDDLDQIQTLYTVGEDATGDVIRDLHARNVKIIVHNLGFEEGVTTCRYNLSLNWYADTMRLSQVYDGGGSDDQFEWIVDESQILEPGDKPVHKRYPLSGLGLVKCARRILGDSEDHKAEAHGWIYANVPECKGKKAGEFLDRLPADILERYTVADVVTTLRLYDFCTSQFAIWEYDWTFDHGLYMSTTHWVVDAKIRGLAVERTDLANYIDAVTIEIDTISQDFRNKFIKQITNLERSRAASYIRTPKTKRGRRARYKKYLDKNPTAWKSISFNVGSNKQLAELFVNQLGIPPKFLTDKGSPSFKSAMLGQWGDGGTMLKARRKRMLVLKQSTSLYNLSADDSRWHLGLRVAATGTGRLAGGG